MSNQLYLSAKTHNFRVSWIKRGSWSSLHVDLYNFLCAHKEKDYGSETSGTNRFRNNFQFFFSFTISMFNFKKQKRKKAVLARHTLAHVYNNYAVGRRPKRVKLNNPIYTN